MGEGFRDLINFIVPEYQVPHRTTFMRTHVPELYTKIQSKIRAELDCADTVAITTDMWKDEFIHNSYITVTAHFINEKWELKSFVLNTKVMNVSHTAANIVTELESIMKDWGLDKKCHTIVTDEGSNMLLAGKLMRWNQVRCFAHRLNLCLTSHGVDKVPDLNILIEKCKKIAKAFRNKGSNVAVKQADFRDFMESHVESDHNYFKNDATVPNTSIKQPVPTRWNSICTMIESIVANEPIINEMLKDFEHADLIMSRSEFDALNSLINFLVPFKEISKQMQGEIYPTISLAWPNVQRLKKICERKNTNVGDVTESTSEVIYYDNDDFGLSDLKKVVLSALNSKFPKTNLYALAYNLDPRFKLFKDRFKLVSDYETSIKLFLKDILENPSKYFSNISQNSSVATTSTSNYFQSIYGDLMDDNETGASAIVAPLLKDIDLYIKLPQISSESIANFNLLVWWRDNSVTFPVLSKIARKVHGIVASSAPSERVFSLSGNCITEKRSRLLPSNVDKLVFLHYNLPRK